MGKPSQQPSSSRSLKRRMACHYLLRKSRKPFWNQDNSKHSMALRTHRSFSPLAIPATLQDSLMARLDRLAPVKDVAQLGAVLGREFAYALLRAVAPLDEATLQHGWRSLSRPNCSTNAAYSPGDLPL